MFYNIFKNFELLVNIVIFASKRDLHALENYCQ